MKKVRAEDAFALEAHLPGDSLRGEVIGIGEQLEPERQEALDRSDLSVGVVGGFEWRDLA